MLKQDFGVCLERCRKGADFFLNLIPFLDLSFGKNTTVSASKVLHKFVLPKRLNCFDSVGTI